MTEKDKSLKARFQALDAKRAEVLNRAEEAAKLTIPSLFVKSGHTETTKLSTPYQGTGARAVNSLAAKISLALFPPGVPFFQMALSSRMAREIGEDPKFTEALSTIEQIAMERLESTAVREVNARTSKSLLVTGNYLLQPLSADVIRGFNLRNYVVERDSMGHPIEVILKEVVSIHALTEEQLKIVQRDPDWETIKESREQEVELYTGQYREGRKLKTWQELNRTRVPGSEGTHPLDAPLLIPVRGTSVDGENYGRSMVQEYIGEFSSLNDLRRDILKASANAAKVIWIRKPGAVLKTTDMTTAASGDVIQGNEGDVKALTMDKYGDFRVSLEQIRDITASLREAFLMNSTVQRNGDRVTAEEIRFVAQELETALGGLYSLLAEEWQRPLINRYLDILQKAGEVPKLPKSGVRLRINTGLAALGRGMAMNQAVSFWRHAADLLTPEGAKERLDAQWLLSELAIGHGVDAKKAVLSNEQVMQNMQQQHMRTMLEKAGPGVAQELTKGAVANG